MTPEELEKLDIITKRTLERINRVIATLEEMKKLSKEVEIEANKIRNKLNEQAESK